MDSSPAPPQHPPPHHQSPLQRHPQQQQQQQHHHPPQNFMVGPPHQSHHVQPQGPSPSQHPNSYSFQSHPVNNLMPHQQQQHQQHQQQQQHLQGNRFPFNSMVTSAGPPHQAKMQMDYSDGGGGVGGTTSPTGGGSGFSIESAKKKRGRPRKYSPDGAGSSIALGLSPTPNPTPVAASMDSGGGGDTLSSENPNKKHRGRPSGSGKKQLDALGTPGVGFTPHVITVKTGEDIAAKIMAFSQQGPRTVCILSANGSICNVTLKQPAASGSTVTYEGRFEIISLSGTLPSENNGSRNGSLGLSVSLAGADGRVLGGGVAGMLMAASPVQIIVGSFIQDGKKQKNAPAIAPAPNMLSFGNNNNNAGGGMVMGMGIGMGMGGSPPSQAGSSGGGGGGGGSSDDDNGSSMNQGPYVNNNAGGGGGQSMPQMYNMGWANSAMKMQHHHPN